MTTQNADELSEPIIRRKALSARNEGGMMTVIDGLSARDSGRFYTWEGTAAPW